MNNISLIKKTTKPLFKKYKIKKSSLFGSFARGDNKKKSDIDILIQSNKGMTLLDLASLKDDLQKKLNRKVDVLTYDSINPLLRENIKQDEIKIYEKR